MPLLSTILQITAPVLFILSLLRYASTSDNSPEKAERGSSSLLLALITVGAFGAAGRDRYRPGSTPFWLTTAGLAVVCALTILVLLQLYRLYRSADDKPARRSNTSVIRPPEITPDSNNNGDKS